MIVAFQISPALCGQGLNQTSRLLKVSWMKGKEDKMIFRCYLAINFPLQQAAIFSPVRHSNQQALHVHLWTEKIIYSDLQDFVCSKEHPI